MKGNPFGDLRLFTIFRVPFKTWKPRYNVVMSKPPLPNELWAIVEPLLRPEPPRPKGGRPRVPDRAALTGIIFVLMSGVP